MDTQFISFAKLITVLGWILHLPGCASEACTDDTVKYCFTNVLSLQVIDFRETFPITDIDGAYELCFNFREGKECLAFKDTTCSDNAHMQALEGVFEIICDPLAYREYAAALKVCYNQPTLRESITTCKENFNSATQYDDKFPMPRDSEELCRHTRYLVSCQTNAVETNCAQNSLDVHRNITYKMIHPLMDAIQCPQDLPSEEDEDSKKTWLTILICGSVTFLIILVLVVCCFACAKCPPEGAGNKVKIWN